MSEGANRSEQPIAATERENASIAMKKLQEHLATESLGGGHPLMVVVPRDELRVLIAGYRRYLAAAVRRTIEEGNRVR